MEHDNKYELTLVMNALRLCLRRQVLFWEGAGLLVGFMCFNFLSSAGLLPTTTVWLFPPMLLMGLFLLYMCVAIGNAGAIALLSRGASPLVEWTDVIPTDRRFIHTVVMSVLFFVLAAVLLMVALLFALPAKAIGPVWLAWFCPIVIVLSIAGIITMFQGVFLFPSFLVTEVEDVGAVQRFLAFLKMNWPRLLRYEGLFLGIAILLSLPEAAVAYLSYFYLKALATNLVGIDAAAGPTLWPGFPGVLTATLGLAPLYAMCALIPTSFITASTYLFCAGTTSGQPPVTAEDPDTPIA